MNSAKKTGLSSMIAIALITAGVKYYGEIPVTAETVTPGLEQLNSKLQENQQAIAVLSKKIGAINTHPVPETKALNAELGNEIRNLIRSELKTFAAAINNNPRAQVVPAEYQEQASFQEDDNLEAYAIAVSLMDTALSEGRWTREDSDDLQEVFFDLKNPQRVEIIKELMAAVETNQIEMETEGLLF